VKRYQPMMTADRVRELRRWHEEALLSMRDSLPRRILYLGLDLRVPEDVFLPSSNGAFPRLLRDEVRPSDRVLDMGTGCGITAILAAATSRDVVAVDINPKAVAAAAANAVRNGVGDRVRVFESDVFDAVDGAFDLIAFNPPFRWFRPRDLLELGTADENYRALTRFIREAPRYLRPGGRIMLHFGTSGDIAYLHRLIDQAGFRKQVLATDEVVTDHLSVTYYVLRLTAS
jgi:release factor glutamine methyltransferase